MRDVSEQRLKAILTGTRAGTWEWQPESGELVVNTRWSEMLGYQYDELTPYSIDTWSRLIHPEDRANILVQFDRHTTGELPYIDAVVRMQHKDGEWRWIHTRGMQIKGADQRMWMVGTHIDVTRQYKLQHQLSQLATSLPGVIYSLSMPHPGAAHFTYISQPVTEALALTPEEVLADASAMFACVIPEDKPRVMAALDESFRTLCKLDCEYRMSVRDEPHWFRTIASPERDTTGGVSWHGLLLNIDTQKQLEQQLERLTVTDELTGLSNRRHLLSRLDELSAMSERYRLGYSVVSIDIDHFKQINDTYGHLVGDRVLSGFAEMIRNRLRQTDVAARMGGEEFMLLLSSTDAVDALTIANELREILASTIFHSDQGTPFHVTLSAGIAGWHPPSAGTREMLANSDHALYVAKHRGRNQCVLFEPGHQDPGTTG